MNAALGGERLADMGGADATGVAKLDEGQRPIRVGEYVFEPVDGRGTTGRRDRRGVDDRERERVAGGAERERDAGLRRRGAVFDGEEQAVVGATEVEVGVAPGMEVGAAAQGLTRADRVRAFAGMMDDDDGEREAPL